VLFEQAEIEEYIAEFLGIEQRDSRAVLKAMEAQHGLLIERSQKVWSFSHLTFQEYLVATHSVDRKEINALAKDHLSNERWLEIFLLVTELLSDGSNSYNWILLLDKSVENYMSLNNLKNILIWLEKMTDYPQNTLINLNSHKAGALFIFLALSIACRFRHDFQKTKHLIIDLLLLEDSDLAGLIDYTLCFITDIADDLQISLGCADEILKSNLFKPDVCNCLVYQLKQLQKTIKCRGKIEAQRSTAIMAFGAWLTALQIHPDMLKLSKIEIDSIHNYIYTSKLLYLCKNI